MTLLEFPTDFTIKIILQNIGDAAKQVKNTVLLYFPKTTQDKFVEKLSKRDQYLSYSINLYVEDKKTLDDLYIALNKISAVKMVL